MRAAVYARVPATRQAQAIEQQLDRLRAAVAERGWSWRMSMSIVMTASAASAWGGRGWTGCGITRRWLTWTWSWWRRRTGWPAIMSARCC